jgi:hypothetical protein
MKFLLGLIFGVGLGFAVTNYINKLMREEDESQPHGV